MVIEDLKRLFLSKENRIVLILMFWLIAGFTYFSFIPYLPEVLGYLFFPPLLGFCFVFFIVSLVTRKDIRELNWKQLLLCVIIGVAIVILFINLNIWGRMIAFFYRFGVILYIFITSIFYMYACYKYAFKADEKAYDLDEPKNHILRWSMFIGGTLLSIVIIRIVAIVGINWARRNPEIVDGIAWVGILVMFIMIGLAVIGILTLLIKRLNAWLGVFFILVTLFMIYLMYNAYRALGSSGDTTYDLWIRILLYLFDLGLIIFTIATIIGEKSEKISETLKIIKVDAVIMLLIFSKAAYEIAAVADPRIPAETINAVLGFILFVPLFAIAGIYGIIKYGKIKKERESAE